MLIGFRHIHERDYADDLLAMKAEVGSVRKLVVLDAPLEGAVMASDFLNAGDKISDDELEAARARVAIDDTAVLIFTSGTTGRPKASHGHNIAPC